MRKIELLAPAGDIQSLYAAVQSGADAVYMGGNKFSARAYASNFDDAAIKCAVDYCHLNNIKVYVTLNTLLKENEIVDAINYAKFLYEIGTDAIIVQDTGLAFLAAKYLPELELHASTQMTIHNSDGAIFMSGKGFKRIVLSRELSLKEIEYISKDLGIETEVFIHGALCICYSGQCLMSSMIGGRSGNRGRCAQPCRLPYTLINKDDGKEVSAYLLSPKDICTIDDIKKIIDSGTTSLKIEGRMKRAEYVAGVVNAYRNAVDKISENDYSSAEDRNTLMQLFNREGFSKAYLFGNTGKDMMAYTFPKNTGVFIGKAAKDLNIRLELPLRVSDGIRVGEEGFSVSKIVKNNIEVNEAYRGDIVKLFPSNYKNGDQLFKTSDVELLERLRTSYVNPYAKKVNLEAEVNFKVGEQIDISTVYENVKFTYSGAVVEKALKKPLERTKIEENFKKSGDTPFRIDIINFISFEDGYLPVSEINALRRGLIEKLERYLIEKSKVNLARDIYIDSDSKELAVHDLPNIMVCVNTKEQLRAAVDCGIKHIAINMFTRKGLRIEDIKPLGNINVYLKVPNIIKQEHDYASKTIEKALPFISGLITANAGIINKFTGRVSIIGDYKLNIYNSYASKFYEKNICGTCISVELNKREIQEMMAGNYNFYMMLIYGRIELMVSEYCPIGSAMGGKKSNSECNRICETETFNLKDRKGENFAVNTDMFCRSYIYNNAPINLINNLDELKKMKIASYRMDFINETYDETVEIIEAFYNRKFEKDFSNYTRGHFKRGVE